MNMRLLIGGSLFRYVKGYFLIACLFSSGPVIAEEHGSLASEWDTLLATARAEGWENTMAWCSGYLEGMASYVEKAGMPALAENSRLNANGWAVSADLLAKLGDLATGESRTPEAISYRLKQETSNGVAYAEMIAELMEMEIRDGMEIDEDSMVKPFNERCASLKELNNLLVDMAKKMIDEEKSRRGE